MSRNFLDDIIDKHVKAVKSGEKKLSTVPASLRKKVEELTKANHPREREYGGHVDGLGSDSES